MLSMAYLLLTINPGSTSTKLALFDDDKERVRESIEHPSNELKKYPGLFDQLPMRSQAVLEFLEKNKLRVSDLHCIVSRGGILPPVHSGAYRINQNMVETIRMQYSHPHASSLGALIANELIKDSTILTIIYDSVSVDELTDVARISGAKEIPRASFNHVLNTRAMCMRYAADINKPYKELNLVAVHLGGGVSINAQYKGQLVDVITAEEGSFSSERAGGLSVLSVMEYCKKNGFDAMAKLEAGKGGFVSYFGTNDTREIEIHADNGDTEAALVLEALAYQVAKSIGQMVVALKGSVDGIVVTGGMAYSKRIIASIKQYAGFLGHIAVYPGEDELKALALGGLRVLQGEEQVNVFEYKPESIQEGR
jgi:butyrate kinase